MAKITQFKGYDGPAPAFLPPKPSTPVDPVILTVQDGVPVAYPDCHGLGVRVVHPANPKAPARHMGLVMFYLPPHTVNAPGSHPTEETYVILEGSGTMTFAGGRKVPVQKGMFVYLPSWCEHGIENTGNENLVVLIATSPPNP
jgi:mannose-6-phosphate isomerase-like protein (cupin superfamily)